MTTIGIWQFCVSPQLYDIVMSGFSLTHTYRACSMELENWLCCSILRVLLFLADSLFRCLISYLCCLHLGPTGA